MTKGEDLAFPFKEHEMIAPSYGLTKREWMATMIMQGIISNEELRMKIRQDKETPEQVAAQMSNSLIKELNKKEK